MIKKILNAIMYPFRKYRERQHIKKRLAELRKRDPFIYK